LGALSGQGLGVARSQRREGPPRAVRACPPAWPWPSGRRGGSGSAGKAGCPCGWRGRPGQCGVPARSLWRPRGSGALGATVTTWSWRWCRAREDL